MISTTRAFSEDLEEGMMKMRMKQKICLIHAGVVKMLLTLIGNQFQIDKLLSFFNPLL